MKGLRSRNAIFISVIAGACTVGMTVFAVTVSAQSQNANVPVSANVKANCTISAAPLAFGTFDPLTATAVSQSAVITLTCTQGSVARITLDNGGNFSTSRRMAGGAPAGFLLYSLYKDSAHTTSWGNEEVSVTTFDANNKATLTIYGQVPAPQSSVSVGNYTDTVKATVNF